MWDFFDQLLSQKELTTQSIVIRIAYSFLLGSLIGVERQARRNAAGIRTFALICLGSCLAMLLSIWMSQVFDESDAGRIAAQALTGIGFLGAGVIMRYRENTFGLTTAACIWVVSVIGLSVGAGMYLSASITTFIVLALLVLLFRFEVVRHVDRTKKDLKISASDLELTSQQIKEVLNSFKLTVADISIVKDFKVNTSTFVFTIFVANDYDEVSLFEALHKLPGISSISLGG
ncbi:MAG: MgtC/SapB family protein [Bacteroidales bacterium]|nr:MgtC/SapB family protein [Bacteroidales bacterium]